MTRNSPLTEKSATKGRMRVFILESPNPMDLLRGVSESTGLESICRLLGHETVSFFIRSSAELETVCNYISSIDIRLYRKAKPLPLCIHVSAHGDKNGLQFGSDSVEWAQLAKFLSPICRSQPLYPAPRIFVLSACCADQQKLTGEFTKATRSKNSKTTPPQYLFVTTGEDVPWADAAVAWTLLYHQLPQTLLDDRKSVQKVLDRIHNAKVWDLRYFRWDNKRREYLKYDPQE